MVSIEYDPSYNTAHAVLAVIASLAQEETPRDDDETVLTVSGFKFGMNSGVHITSSQGRLMCNITTNNMNGDIILNIGTTHDYEYETGHAKETATRYDYRLEEIYQCASDTLKWLLYDRKPIRVVTNPPRNTF
jgi:hypothetical protein